MTSHLNGEVFENVKAEIEVSEYVKADIEISTNVKAEIEISEKANAELSTIQGRIYMYLKKKLQALRVQLTSRFLHTTKLEKICVSMARNVKGREDAQSLSMCESGACCILWCDWRNSQRRFTLQCLAFLRMC